VCGLAGILIFAPPDRSPPPRGWIQEAWLDRLDGCIARRGPDGHGRFRQRVRTAGGAWAEVALVHRRLAVIDPAGGAQPLLVRPADLPSGSWAAPEPADAHAVDEHRSEVAAACVFNGCIYNHRPLRRELAAAGHVFRTDHADTEVLPHAVLAWGDAAASRLRGMFGAGVWVAARGELTLMRDPMGEKPLCVAAIDGAGPLEACRVWVFGSTASAVIHGVVCVRPDVPPRRLAGDCEAWVRYGWGDHPPGDLVRNLRPGETLVIGAEGERRRVDRPEIPAGDGARRGSLSVAEVSALVRRAVESRLESDVPLGCLLSGGVDSSVVAAVASRALGRLRTFTVRMPEARYDESAHARRVAEALGTEHVTLDCRADPGEDLETLITQAGVPLADSSLLPMAWVARAAAEQVKVLLSGDGGDELFAGYERTRAAAWLAGVRGAALRTAGRLVAHGPLPRWLARAHPKSRRSKLGRLLTAARWGGPLELLSIVPTPLLRSLLGREPAPPGSLMDGPAPCRVDGPAALLAWELDHALPGDLLLKADCGSMHAPVELRAPLLDVDLVAACARAPLSDLMPGGRPKGLLRAVARSLVGPALADRPKMGFAVPLGAWFRTDYGGLRTRLADRLHSSEPFGPEWLGLGLDVGVARRLLHEHVEGLADHAQRLHLLLVFSIWGRWLGRVLRGASGSS
jgi:asparagine synthase (glutamine-hydrolysing)